jgi:acyl-CoA synthetase (NDP forming)/GNAT superfamily N-acetyltransferase
MDSPRLTSDALLIDGEIVQIRTADPADLAGVGDLHQRVSPRSLYLRYFTAAPNIDKYLRHLLRAADDAHEVLVVSLRDQVVGVAGYEQLADPASAEVAFLVDDAYQGLGIATLLLEHLAAEAFGRGVERFVAETLPQNAAMLGVFRDAGFPVSTRYEDGVVAVSFPTVPDARALQAADQREASADHSSLQALLSPRSVTVVGTGRDASGLGHRVLANLLHEGYQGPVYAVNRSVSAGDLVGGVPAYSSVTEVPGVVDLVVVAVPAQEVLEVARHAAARQARSLAVLTADFTETRGRGSARQQQLLDLCRAEGMRLVGPGCMGVANTADDVRLNATVGPALPLPGAVGLMSQSGSLGIAALQHARRAGIGISSFVSAGNKADVSGNDLLCYWERDPATRVCALYLESFGNPRKFARIAGRVSRTKPVVVVKSGRSVEGSYGARSHNDAAATPEVAVDALFAQAGVIRADSLLEMFEVVTLLEHAPLPAGFRVAVVGNSGGPGVLAADACVAAGLQVGELSESTRAALSSLLPAGASTGNPVDMLADTDAATVRSCLETVLADPGVDAVIAVYTPVRSGETAPVAEVIAEVGSVATKPLIAVMFGLLEPPDPFRDSAGRLQVPFHAFPETAARSLGAVARYAMWRARPVGTPAELDGVDTPRARRLVDDCLAADPDGGWLPSATATELVSCFGIPTVETIAVATAEEAVAAARKIGYPVALKAAAGELLHKTENGGVSLRLADEDAVRSSFDEMQRRLGTRMGGAVVQPMITAGVEAAVGVVNDPSFGPLVMFGLGGVASDLLADRAFRILPLTREDAAAHVRSLRASPLLFGYRGSEPVDGAALEDLLLRVAELADTVPEVAELDLNPVMATAAGASAVDVKIRLERRPRSLALLRRLSPR